MSRYKYIIPATLAASMPLAGIAQEAVAAKPSGFEFNPVLTGLVSLIVILLFVIIIAANVMRQLAAVSRERIRKNKTKAVTTAVLLALLSLATISPVVAQEVADAAAVPFSGFISGIREDVFYLIVGVISLELLVLFFMLLQIRVLIKVATGKYELATVKKAIKVPVLDIFNKSVPIEKEADILLDHDYDGIQELDNSLPPWWKYGFYLSILVAFIYIGYYHFGSGPSSQEEYVAAVEKAEAEVATYLKMSANNVDENTVTPVQDAGDMAKARGTFETVCAACHAKDGGGGVGPNLTDVYWLHGGSLKDIFKSIKYGWQDKGMKSWKDDYSPKEIAALATYVQQLKGTIPAAPKEAQGEIYNDNEPGKEGPQPENPALTDVVEGK